MAKLFTFKKGKLPGKAHPISIFGAISEKPEKSTSLQKWSKRMAVKSEKIGTAKMPSITKKSIYGR